MKQKLLGMLLLGFASGLPYMLVFSTLSAWLRDVGISLTEIGFFAWLVLTYSLKFLWAPLVDRYSIPLFGRLGKRKGWILFCQFMILIALLGMSASDPIKSLQFLAIFAFLAAFFGSVQDIAIDALRIEIADNQDQGNLAASYQLGYRIAILVATSLALIFADQLDWRHVYQFMSILMIVGMLGVIISHEPINKEIAILRMDEALLLSFKDFFHRFGIWTAALLLLLISTYRLTDIVMGPMAMPFYLDMGFTKTEIGALVKTVALAASIAGFFVGGYLIKNLLLTTALLAGGAAVLVTNLFFALVANLDANLSLLSLIVGLDSFAAGLVGTINIAFLTSLVSKKYTAVQYAMLTSFMMLPGKFFSGFSGVIADYYVSISSLQTGWAYFFYTTSAMSIPALLLIMVYKNSHATHSS
ncbi:MFS transporter [Gammaproteobacteria bacterium]|jgi:PAT family beta-lactamase induction signal transducer AmpG|nr:MFS transporter [Gammaproteobacteria bacterium]MDA9974158.1 MFS transporter [Gammaproteobacteria bacterium]MDC1475336.1 MFS transporter [Gammaproteobacteria bacterium]|tara:strand:+ start:4690 stop:5934 length:1245 start_codon:yes stop_codon:yes gene_type:complete